MAITVSNVSRLLLSIDTGAKTATYQLSGSYSGNTDRDAVYRRIQVALNGTTVYGPTFGGGTQTSATFNTSTSGDPALTCDEAGYSWRSGITTPGVVNADYLYFKSDPIPATSSTPTSSNVAATTADIACNYYPNTLDSTCSAQLQYKKTTDVAWTDAGAAASSSGYTQTSISRSLTGLSGSTNYQFRLVLTRTTSSDTTHTSDTSTFTTLADTPTITTDAATTVTSSGAALNGTVVLGNQASANVKWVYGTANPPVAGVGDGLETSYASNPVTVDGSYGKAVTGLTASTTYYFFAKVYWNSDTESYSGSVLSFATPADPAAEAANEDHMQIFEFDRKYKTATTVYFTVASPAATSSDRWFDAASPFVAGDIQVSIDGAPFANVDTLPTRIGTTSLFSMPLLAAETDGTDIYVQIVDQDGPLFRDALLHIRTKLQTGQIDVDASQIGSSASAMSLTPSTGGYGISGTGSPTLNGSIRTGLTQAGSAGGTIVLDASASGTDDFYNGCIVVVTSGTGIAQARVITDYVQTTKTATVNKTWGTTPGTGDGFLIIPGNDLWEVSPLVELAAMPSAASGFGKMLQFLFQRFAYKRTQTSTLHTMMKADSSTPLVTAAVADSAGTQSFGKLA